MTYTIFYYFTKALFLFPLHCRYTSTSHPDYWTALETTNPLSLSYNPSYNPSSSSSSFPLTCDMNSTLTCSRCGLCTTDNTTANLCIGDNGDLFGPMATDCPEGTIEDRNGYCCPENQLNCAGFCSTWYVEAMDSTNSYPVCCFVDVGIVVWEKYSFNDGSNNQIVFFISILYH